MKGRVAVAVLAALVVGGLAPAATAHVRNTSQPQWPGWWSAPPTTRLGATATSQQKTALDDWAAQQLSWDKSSMQQAIDIDQSNGIDVNQAVTQDDANSAVVNLLGQASIPRDGLMYLDYKILTGQVVQKTDGVELTAKLGGVQVQATGPQGGNTQDTGNEPGVTQHTSYGCWGTYKYHAWWGGTYDPSLTFTVEDPDGTGFCWARWWMTHYGHIGAPGADTPTFGMTDVIAQAAECWENDVNSQAAPYPWDITYAEAHNNGADMGPEWRRAGTGGQIGFDADIGCVYPETAWIRIGYGRQFGPDGQLSWSKWDPANGACCGLFLRGTTINSRTERRRK